MTKYEVENKISSCEVDINLLKSLEKYLYDVVSHMNTEDAKQSYSVCIYDKYGEERFDSFNNYHRNTLPNDTKRIVMSVGRWRSDFYVRISLSNDPLYSSISVNVYSESAKEKAIGIIKGAESIIAEHKNINSIFYGNHNILMPMIIGFTIVPSYSLLIDNELNIKNTIGTVLFLSLTIYYALKFVSPYCMFDTKSNKQIKTAIKWILNGLAGVFFFGVIATLLRNGLLGY